METSIEKQNTKALEFARLFEVEELEERIEFGKWSAEAGSSTDTSTGATTIDTKVRWEQ